MADYNDLIRAGLLNAGDRRDAGLMGLIALGQSIGNRGAARLSPTPPPLDLAGPMAVYQNSMNTALQRGALAKKLNQETALRKAIMPQPVNEPMAQRMAQTRFEPTRQALTALYGYSPLSGEDNDMSLEAGGIPAMAQDAVTAALPAARQMTTVPKYLQSVPAAARPLISAVSEANPMAGLQMAGDLMAKTYTPRKQPSIVQEYEYARANGYDGSFQDFVKFKGSSAAPKNYSTIPPGYRMVTDGDGTPSRLEVIPGGPAEQAAADAKSAEGTSMVSRAQTARLVIDTADQILDVMNGTDQPVTGRISQPLGFISTLPAGRVRTLVRQLQSPIALGALTRLKESSKTGASGFGALNTAELTLLIDEIGRLDPDTTAPDIFQDNVKRIRSRYQSVIDNIKKEVTPDRIQELGLGPLLGISVSSQGKTRRRWNQETQKFEEVPS
jgi:hypothetical protein